MKKFLYKKQNLRPTTSKVKNAVFSIMGHYNLQDKSFLDLYAGTGSIGLKALELGVEKCIFVDNNQEFLTLIKSKLIKQNFYSRSKLVRANCETQLNKIIGCFDYIFVDPPYEMKPFEKICDQLINNELIHEKTKLFFEHSSRIVISDEYKIFKKNQEKKYGDTSISIFVL